MTIVRRVLAGALAAAAVSACAAVPAAQAASVKGKWKGTLTIAKGAPSASFPVVMKIGSLQRGQSAGRISYPGTVCAGKGIYLGRKGPEHRFRYLETAQPDDCAGNDRISVSRSGARLRWKSISPDGIVVKGRLKRA